MCVWRPVANKLYSSGRQSDAKIGKLGATGGQLPSNCTRVAASRMQKLNASGGQSHTNCTRLVASSMHIVPEWLPVACKFPLILFMLHATGGHPGTICMQLAATRVQFVSDWLPVASKFCKCQRPVACKAASFLQARCEYNYLN